MPFQMIWLPLTKFVPVAVRASGAEIPFVAVLGLSDVRVGTGPEPPPPAAPGDGESQRSGGGRVRLHRADTHASPGRDLGGRHRPA